METRPMRRGKRPPSIGDRGRALALLLLVLLALASVAGYRFLSGKIAAGKEQFAEGRTHLEQKEPALEQGKAELEAGKQRLSEGKRAYEDARDNWFLVFADKVLRGGKGFREARERIAEGDRRMAEGADKVSAGERRVEAGKLDLRLGSEQLRLASGARWACAAGALFFAAVAIGLGFRWRRGVA